MASSSSSSSGRRLESPSAERNKEPIWEVLSSKVFPILQKQQNQKQPEGDDDQTTTPIIKILEIAAGTGVHTEYFASQLLLLLQLQLQSYSDSDLSSPASSSLNPNPNPPFLWYPTDPTEEARESIRSRINGNVNNDNIDIEIEIEIDSRLNKVIAQPMAVTLDASGICKPSKANFPPFASAKLDLILCINMIHISPWEATLGLMKLAGTRLVISSRSRSEDGDDDDDDDDYDDDRDIVNDNNNNDDGGYLYCYGPFKEDGKVVPSNENFDASLKSRNPEWGVRNLKDVIKAANDEGLELVHCISMPSNNTSLIFRRKRS